MTDRFQTLTVILDDDYREDDAHHIANVISAIRGVYNVELGDKVATTDYLARERAVMKIEKDVLKTLRKHRKSE